MCEKFAILNNNIVVNTVVCEDEQSATENFGMTEGFSVVKEVPEETGLAHRDYLWDGTQFIPDPNPTPEPEPEPTE